MSSTFFLKGRSKTAINFEFYVHELLKKDFSNCAITEQKRLESGVRPDFIIECEEKIIVVDAKVKEKLSKSDIDQIKSYLVEIDADYGIIYVAHFTTVSSMVEDYAILNAIEIEYTDWRSKITKIIPK